MGRYGEIWGDQGRSDGIKGDRTWAHEELEGVLACLLEGCNRSFDLYLTSRSRLAFHCAIWRLHWACRVHTLSILPCSSFAISSTFW